MDKMTKLTDEQLVAAYAKGNNEAFDALLKRHQQRVFSYILSVVKNRDIADDIFQETFVKAVVTIRQGRYSESGRFASWITRIAHNLVIDHFRQTKSEALVSTDNEETDILNRLDLSELTIEDQLISRQTTEEIRDLLRRLPLEQRKVVAMRFYRNMSFKEIADATGVSINTALGRMRYALINMRRMIQEEELSLTA